MIESVYRHYISNGGALSIQEFLYANVAPSQDDFGNRRMFQRFRYHAFIKYAMRLFGEDCVKIIVFEDLKTVGPKAVAEDIISFVGLDLSTCKNLDFTEQFNTGISYLGAALRRRINWFLPTPHNSPPILSGFNFLDTSRFHHNLYVPADRKILSKFYRSKKFINRPSRPFLARAFLALHGSKNANRADTIADDIRAAYAESNRQTSELIGIDLSSYGYAT
ncbi:MAG: hypothetical protein JJ900_12845 [Rhodospirillales bacterium]|nr:hypothetical protein [Rhodospirillales bacterium]MBO6787733.1 hypothetical protein [Rhodospirillales bacterium]